MDERLYFVQSILDAVPEIVYAFDQDRRWLWWNDRLSAATGYTNEEIDSLDPLAFVADEDELTITTMIDRVVSEGSVEAIESHLVTKTGEEIPYEFTGGPLTVDGTTIGLAGVAREIQTRHTHPTELAGTDAVSALLGALEGALAKAETPADIESAVCRSIVDGSDYSGAAIWRRRRSRGVFERRAVAGDKGPLSALITEDEAGESPAALALREESVEIQEWRSGEPPVRGEAARGETAEGDGQSRRRRGGTGAATGTLTLAAAPIVIGERSTGVLGVSTDRSEAFTKRECTILEALGTRIAAAIRAALTRQLLYADTVTEIELRTTDRNAVFVSLSDAADCRFELERAVGFEDTLVVYERVTGTTAERVRELVAADERIECVGCLHSDGEQHTFEFRIAGESAALTSVLLNYGARVTGWTAGGGSATITVELPSDEDPRLVYDAISERLPETELVAIRENRPSMRTEPEFRERIDDAMTTKQRGALEAAFVSGYFDWPARSSTAEEIAATLGIAPQTFHQHLRIAQRKVFDVVFDRDDSEPSPLH